LSIPSDSDFGNYIYQDVFGVDGLGGPDGYEEDEDHLETYCLTNSNGNALNLGPLMPNSIHDFSSGLAVVAIGEKVGAIDKTGKIIVPIIYDYLAPFRNGLATAITKISEEKFKPVILTKTGQILLEDFVIVTWLGIDRLILMNRSGEFFDFSFDNNKRWKSLGKDMYYVQRFKEYLTFNYKNATTRRTR
jgi:hypothetical protein